MNLVDKIGRVYIELCEFFREREEIIKAMLLGLLSKQHVLLLGPPGTAKSAMARAIAGHVGAKYFEYLLTRYTAPEELFGFLSIKKAVEQESFERNIDGMLPQAEIAFLDEIFKANSAILNSLLTIINERIYHNGRQVLKVPLITLYAASNELPEEEELSALYDRLLIRTIVEYLRDEDEFKRVIQSEDIYTPRTKIKIDELKNAHNIVENIDVSGVVDSVVAIRRELRSKGITLSDRRYKLALKVVKASAFFHGRNVATMDDLRVLQYILWDAPEQIEEVSKTVLNVVDPFAKRLYELKTILKELENQLDQVSTDNVQEFMAKLKTLENDVKETIKQINMAGRDPTEFQEILDSLMDFKMRILEKVF